MLRILHFLWDEWTSSKHRIAELKHELDALALNEDSCRPLLSVPGVGHAYCNRPRHYNREWLRLSQRPGFRRLAPDADDARAPGVVV
jgi:hypothetical protein